MKLSQLLLDILCSQEADSRVLTQRPVTSQEHAPILDSLDQQFMVIEHPGLVLGIDGIEAQHSQPARQPSQHGIGQESGCALLVNWYRAGHTLYWEHPDLALW